MSSLSISTAWDETRAILARDGKLFAAVALGLVVLPEVVFAVVGAPVGTQANALSGTTYVIVILLGCVAQIALNRLAIGPSVTVGTAIATGFARLVSVAVVGAAMLIAVTLVAVLLLTILSAAHLITVPSPGQTPPPALLAMLVVLVALAFAIYLLVFPLAAVETGNPIRLISRSWQLARHHYLRLLGFVAIIFVGAGLIAIAMQVGLGSVIVIALGRPSPGSMSALVLGLIAGVVQGAFTIVTAVMLARIYLQLAGRGEEVGEVFR